MINGKAVLLLFIFLVLCFVFYNGFRTFILLRKTAALEALEPFEQNPPSPAYKIAVIGDSTAVGTGSNTNKESVAGRFGSLFPDAEIINKGINGQKIGQLTNEFDSNDFPHLDLLIIQIGANDIVQFTSIKKTKEHLDLLLDKASKISSKVVILHGGNVGNAPFFPKYLGFIWSYRTKEFRDLYMSEAKEYGAVYVDLYEDLTHDVFLTNTKKYYADDQFHPSGEGYKVWFDTILETLNKKYGQIL